MLVINKITCFICDHGQTKCKNIEMLTRKNLAGVADITLVSNVCEVALRSLFCAPSGLNKLTKVHFGFPLILISKLSMAFFTSQSWHTLKSWYTGGGPEQGYWCCFADGLNQT